MVAGGPLPCNTFTLGLPEFNGVARVLKDVLSIVVLRTTVLSSVDYSFAVRLACDDGIEEILTGGSASPGVSVATVVLAFTVDVPCVDGGEELEPAMAARNLNR